MADAGVAQLKMGTSRKRAWKRKAKEACRSNKLWAEGVREDLMHPHIEAYADALARGWRAERNYWQKVCNEFHGRISWRLRDHEEPELPLPAYDLFVVPPEEILSDEERTKKRSTPYRIRQWLKYRVRALCKSLGSKTDVTNPFAVLLAKLSAVMIPHKARQSYQQYMRELYARNIAAEVDARWKAQSIDKDGAVNMKTPNAPFRCAEAIWGRAVAEAHAEKAAYDKAMKAGPSQTPEAKQKCIDSLAKFMGPLIKGLQEYTGLHCLVVLGGPMPKHGGAIRTVHLSGGCNHDSVPVHFPAWNKLRFGREVLGFMKEYLATAFSAEECSKAALPAAASLADVPYQMDDQEPSDSDSDSESGSESESAASKAGESDSDSDDSASESGSAAEGGGGKKARKAKKTKAKLKEKEKAGTAPKRKQGKGEEESSSKARKRTRAQEKED
ncbi:hypothetical protein B0H17DRAFT_1217557 [Mycena rosella]|uniref:Uncharacterized protein n=1 Tax=Mycena rosella TaxID=1033263 RepID=A0AAD7BVK7_MYCRO|nr:hypothetical protein B0H17DRAFT_1217557 [Mycena rosella]